MGKCYILSLSVWGRGVIVAEIIQLHKACFVMTRNSIFVRAKHFNLIWVLVLHKIPRTRNLSIFYRPQSDSFKQQNTEKSLSHVVHGHGISCNSIGNRFSPKYLEQYWTEHSLMTLITSMKDKEGLLQVNAVVWFYYFLFDKLKWISTRLENNNKNNF